MRAEIKLLHQRLKTTTVYVTHDQIEAMTLGDRIAVMKDGVVQQFGTPQEIYNGPANLFVASFIGSPPMNFVSARQDGGGLAANGQAVPVNAAQQAAIGSASATGEVLYGIRPEHIGLSGHGDSLGVPGTLKMIEPTGPETYLLVDTPMGPVTSRVAGNPHLRVGDAVRLHWEAASAHLFDAKDERRLA